MTAMETPEPSPLCPVHFPDAVYLGEVVPGFYLGLLTQTDAIDHLGVRLTGVTGRYGLFLEDGGCGQLVGLFAGVPTPCPISDETDALIDATYALIDQGEAEDLPDDLAAAADAYVAWVPGPDHTRFLLNPVDGHALVAAAQAAGYDPSTTGTLRRFDTWLYDRAGRLATRA